MVPRKIATKQGRRSECQAGCAGLPWHANVEELFHLFEVSRLPAPLERAGEGSIQAQVSEPTLAWDGLDPRHFLAWGCVWAEVEVSGATADFILQLKQRAQGGLALVGVDLRAAVGII